MFKDPIKVSRYGAHGILCQDNQILLTLKASGPYKGLWGLPGGGIEFGESPEEALKREFLEEVALAVHHAQLLCVASSNSQYSVHGEPHLFHHIGIIYKIIRSSSVLDRVPEDESCWMSLSQIDLDQLTPFAKLVLNQIDWTHNDEN